MFLLMMILKREEYIEEILTALLDLEIVEVISIDGESLENLLGKHLPIFAELRYEMREERKRKLLITIVNDESVPEKLCKLLKEGFDIDFKKDGGIIALIPLKNVVKSE